MSFKNNKLLLAAGIHKEMSSFAETSERTEANFFGQTYNESMFNGTFY